MFYLSIYQLLLGVAKNVCHADQFFFLIPDMASYFLKVPDRFVPLQFPQMHNCTSLTYVNAIMPYYYFFQFIQKYSMYLYIFIEDFILK